MIAAKWIALLLILIGFLSVAGGFWRASRPSFEDDPMLTVFAIGAGAAAVFAGGLWLWVLIFMSIR